MTPLLTTRGLTATIADIRVCRDLDLSIEPATCWGILGPNGVGKTTLLHTLAGIRSADHGTLELEGHDVGHLSRRAIAQRIGVLFQESGDPFPSTVMETALIGRHPHINRWWQWEGVDDRHRAAEAIEAVGLGGTEARSVATLSGGERRRLAIAAILTQDPAVYLLDEPTNHLDLHHQIAALELLTERVRTRQGALIATLHDVNLAARFCDRLLLLYGDGAYEQGATDEILATDRLQRLYGHPFAAVPGPRGTAYLPR